MSLPGCVREKTEVQSLSSEVQIDCICTGFQGAEEIDKAGALTGRVSGSGVRELKCSRLKLQERELCCAEYVVGSSPLATGTAKS